VILLDFWEEGIRHERHLRRAVLILFVLLMVPLTAAMLWPFLAPPGAGAG
jgi:hypothetical protein